MNASPVDPKEGRFDRAANLLRVATIAVVVLCACSLLVHAREPDAALGDHLLRGDDAIERAPRLERAGVLEQFELQHRCRRQAQFAGVDG